MAIGKVKRFNEEKGYGSIQADEGGPDVFVHADAVRRASLTTLPEGSGVSYDVQPGRNGKMSAENLRIG